MDKATLKYVCVPVCQRGPGHDFQTRSVFKTEEIRFKVRLLVMIHLTGNSVEVMYEKVFGTSERLFVGYTAKNGRHRADT